MFCSPEERISQSNHSGQSFCVQVARRGPSHLSIAAGCGSVRFALKHTAPAQPRLLMWEDTPGAYLTQISSDSRFPSAEQSQPEKSLQSWESARARSDRTGCLAAPAENHEALEDSPSGVRARGLVFPGTSENRAKSGEGDRWRSHPVKRTQIASRRAAP